jgi:SNF2 family DNA or RNA helicase
MAKYEFKTEPYMHQREALMAWDRPYFGWFMEMGTGKTKVAIDNTCILYMQKKINGMVILAPKGLYLTWLKQIEIHMPAQYQEQSQIGVWRANPSGKIMKRIQYARISEGLGILLMNTEAVNSKSAREVLKKFMNDRECIIHIDESTKIKNVDAKRTQNIIELGKFAKYKRILTGSPVVNNPMDLFGQSQFLKEGLISKTKPGFRNQFCVTRNLEVTRKNDGRRFTIPTIVGTKNIDRLQEHVEEWSYRARKKDCLDLPEKVYTTIDVEMTTEQKKIYNEFKQISYYKFNEESELSASVVITHLLRLHQIVCGHVVDDEGNDIEIPENRLDTLMEILENFDGKAIIWANYIKDIEKIMTAIQNVYGREAAVPYYGLTSLNERARGLELVENGPARFLVGNTQTAGYGLTLLSTTTHIYYSNNYNLESRIQSEDRSHRIGQRNTVTYIDLVTQNTVDERILHALRNKIDLAAAIQADGPQKWVV